MFQNPTYSDTDFLLTRTITDSFFKDLWYLAKQSRSLVTKSPLLSRSVLSNFCKTAIKWELSMHPRKPRSCDGALAILLTLVCCSTTSVDFCKSFFRTDFPKIALPLLPSRFPVRAATQLLVGVTKGLVKAFEAFSLRATCLAFTSCHLPTCCFGF